MPRGAGTWLAERILPGITFISVMATPTCGFASLGHEVYLTRVQGGGTRMLNGFALRELLSRESEDVI